MNMNSNTILDELTEEIGKTNKNTYSMYGVLIVTFLSSIPSLLFVFSFLVPASIEAMNLGDMAGSIYLMLIVAWVLWIYAGLYYFFLVFIEKQILLRKIRLFIEAYSSSVNPIDSIDTILEILSHIYSIVQKKRIYMNDVSSTNTQLYKEQNSKKVHWKNIIAYLLRLLFDLRSDLFRKIETEKIILESAQENLSNTLDWTRELEQVSELQKVRLDRQIEQFEELQKVLVKM